MPDPSIGAEAAAPDGHGRPELVVVGAASRDLDRADERGWRLGGAVSYGALTAARLGIRTHVLMGADSDAAGASELDLLRGARAQVEIVPLKSGPVFENRQVGRRRHQHALQNSDPMPASALPEPWRRPRALLLGPVAAELGDDWATAVPEDTFVVLAWQGLLRALVPGAPVRPLPLEPTPTVRRADMLFVSAEDVVAGGPPLTQMLREGQELVVTGGDRGAIHLRLVDGRIRARLIRPRPRRGTIDSTGAGDVFLASYLAARLRASHLHGSPQEWRLFAVASAAASLKVAATGLRGVPTLRDLCRAVLTPRD